MTTVWVAEMSGKEEKSKKLKELEKRVEILEAENKFLSSLLDQLLIVLNETGFNLQLAARQAQNQRMGRQPVGQQR